MKSYFSFFLFFYVTIDKNASLDVCALNATLIMFFDKLFFIVLIFAIISHNAKTKMPNTITNNFENYET